MVKDSADPPTPPRGYGIPQVTVNRNGYTVRADILGYAAKHLESEHTFKVGEYSHKYSTKDGRFQFDAEYPKPPTVEDVIATAEKFYQFVCKNSK